MMNNNWQRLNLWLTMKDRFDYAEYVEVCQRAGVAPQPALEFAQKAGMISCGVVAYPKLTVADAYLKFIAEHQQTPLMPRGFGDTVAKITHATGLDSISKIYTQITGKPCGCASRQEALNKLLPYNIHEEATQGNTDLGVFSNLKGD